MKTKKLDRIKGSDLFTTVDKSVLTGGSLISHYYCWKITYVSPNLVVSKSVSDGIQIGSIKIPKTENV